MFNYIIQYCYMFVNSFFVIFYKFDNMHKSFFNTLNNLTTDFEKTALVYIFTNFDLSKSCDYVRCYKNYPARENRKNIAQTS